MIENQDLLVNWSRGQFALTALYHWLFVPLTLGLSFIMAFMETLYVKTGKAEYKRMTRFWMSLFGINFAIGVATGLILEFQFGTNWSKYSWFVGDIFGAPLAIEGIMAFFLESTFIAVMFFGWNKVSKRFHLVSTWLVAIGANLSALWILVANAWMQYPIGMRFNPETARNEMYNFWDVLLSPVAAGKFLHTISSGFVLASVFVIGISCWFLLKKRETLMARKSILIAAVFGLVSSIFLVLTGDKSARDIGATQPMKIAAFEGLFEGKEGAGLVAFGIMKPAEDNAVTRDFYFKIEFPKVLSYMIAGDGNAFVPGIKDLLAGNEKYNIMSAQEKMRRGKIARETLQQYKNARDDGNDVLVNDLKTKFEDQHFLDNYFKYFGYSFIENPLDLIPNVPMVFYSFHIMVMLGFYFILFFALAFFLTLRHQLEKYKIFLYIGLWTIPLAYLATMLGWIVAEMGRQPWAIQDLLPTMSAVTSINVNSVITTFWLFAFLFTALLIAEVSIMVKQIKTGPKENGGH